MVANGEDLKYQFQATINSEYLLAFDTATFSLVYIPSMVVNGMWSKAQFA